ncbi:MAG: monovalent cation/H+ antiporter complex subunit F [Actinomycetota bacterium]|nr:monovalent cation/H+ antiporter complex subunit F [Actinomycetota bacterium]
MTILTWLIGGLLTLSALLTLLRIVVGPSVLDRVVATDVLVSIVVCSLGAHVALNPGSSALPLLISLSLVGFMGSVAVARFVARDRDFPVEFAEPGPEPEPEPEPESDPGPDLEAEHELRHGDIGGGDRR